MTFLHPWAIWIGVAAAAGPLLIHWLTRPRPTRYPLSTLRFVREAIRQRRSWHRLRNCAAADPADAGRVADRPGPGTAAMGAAAPGLRSRRQRRRAGGAAGRQPEHGGPRGGRRADRAGPHHRRPLAPLSARAGGQPDSRRARPQGVFEVRRRTSTPCATSWPAAAPCRNVWMSIGPWTWPPACCAPASPADHRRRELVRGQRFPPLLWAKADFSPLPADTRIQLESTAPAQPLANVGISRPGPCGWLPGRHATGRRRGQLYAHRRARSPSRRPSAIRPGG